MATLRFTEKELVIEMHGMDKFWALRSTFSIPLEHVQRVEARPKDAHVKNMGNAIRVGSYVPGYVLAGYYRVWAGAGPNAADIFHALEQAKNGIEQWPQGGASPRESSHRDKALEHVARATESMRAAAQEAGVSPDDKGGGWVFYEVHDPEKAIAIDLAGEKVRRAVVEIEGMTPDDAVKAIEEAKKKK
jgi:hypothetical protein